MTEETPAETTTRPDAPTDEESIFGDAADDAPATDAGEQNPNVEAKQDEQDSEDAGDKTGAADDLKVVVSIKGDRATIGVQQPSSDPHVESFDSTDLSGLVGEVAAVTARARARWEESPKHPAYARPAPPARRRNRRQQGEAQASTAEGAAEPEQAQTPRLF